MAIANQWNDWALNESYLYDEPNNTVHLENIPINFYLQEINAYLENPRANPSLQTAIAFNSYKQHAITKLQALLDCALYNITQNRHVATHTKIVQVANQTFIRIKDIQGIDTAQFTRQQPAQHVNFGNANGMGQAGNYISPKSVEISPFCGDPKIDKLTVKQYVRQVELAAEAGKWDNDTVLKQVQKSLQRQALNWFDYTLTYEAQTFQSWETLRAALIKNFAPDESNPDNRIRVFNLKMKTSNPTEFKVKCGLAAIEFMKPFKQATSLEAAVQMMTRDIARIAFILGAPEEMRNEFVRQDKLNADMETLEN